MYKAPAKRLVDHRLTSHLKYQGKMDGLGCMYGAVQCVLELFVWVCVVWLWGGICLLSTWILRVNMGNGGVDMEMEVTTRFRFYWASMMREPWFFYIPMLW